MTSPSDIAGLLSMFDTATLHEAYGGGDMSPNIAAMVPGARVVGPAMTVACPEGDNLELHFAIAAAQPGSVIVAQTHSTRYGVWGEVMTVAAIARGIVGLVVDGCVRDIEAIRAHGFPVFARGTAIRGTEKRARGFVGGVITCGGLMVADGDYVVGDESGVVSVPASAARDVLARAEQRREKETKLMSALKDGATTVDLLKLAVDHSGAKE